MRPELSIIPERSAVVVDPKRCFDKAQREQIYTRDRGKCAICKGFVARHESWTAGHIIRHSDGGRTIVENGQIECHKNGCNLITQKIDTSGSARTKRMKRAHEEGRGRKRKGPQIQSRGFDKTLTKGFDGKVRKRDR